MVLAWMTAPTGKTNGQAGRLTAIRKTGQTASQSVHQTNKHIHRQINKQTNRLGNIHRLTERQRQSRHDQTVLPKMDT